MNRYISLLSFLIFLTGCETELERCQKQLIQEQQERKKERDDIARYLGAIVDIQTKIDKIIAQGGGKKRVYGSEEFPSGTDMLKNDFDVVEKLIAETNSQLDLAKTQNLELAQEFNNLKIIITKQKKDINKLRSTIGMLKEENRTLQSTVATQTTVIQEKEEENETLSTENQDLQENLKKKEEEAKIERARKQAEIAAIEAAEKAKANQKYCVLRLKNGKRIEKPVTTNTIVFSCKIKEKYIESPIPEVAYFIKDNAIYIKNPNIFWRNGNKFLIEVKDNNCDFHCK